MEQKTARCIIVLRNKHQIEMRMSVACAAGFLHNLRKRTRRRFIMFTGAAAETLIVRKRDIVAIRLASEE